MMKKAIKSASELTIKEILTAASWMGLTMENPKAKKPQLLQDFIDKLQDEDCESCDDGKCGASHQFAMDQLPFVDELGSDGEEEQEEILTGNGPAAALDQILNATRHQNPGLATSSSTSSTHSQVPPSNTSNNQTTICYYTRSIIKY